jgi:hypothetical protein
MTNEAKSDPHIKLVGTEHTITPGNPFANLAKLRQSQDYEEFLGGEAVTRLNVRTLKEDMHLRVNPDPNYSLLGQYVIPAQAGRGTYFVFPQFRDALGALPRRCNLHIAVDGHGEYFLLLIKQANPGSGQEDNAWYTTARTVEAAAARTVAADAAATEGWIKVTKPVGGGWGHIKVEHEMFKPDWPTKPMEELLYNAFPDMVVNSLSHDLILQFKRRGA